MAEFFYDSLWYIFLFATKIMSKVREALFIYSYCFWTV